MSSCRKYKKEKIYKNNKIVNTNIETADSVRVAPESLQSSLPAQYCLHVSASKLPPGATRVSVTHSLSSWPPPRANDEQPRKTSWRSVLVEPWNKEIINQFIFWSRFKNALKKLKVHFGPSELILSFLLKNLHNVCLNPYNNRHLHTLGMKWRTSSSLVSCSLYCRSHFHCPPQGMNMSNTCLAPDQKWTTGPHFQAQNYSRSRRNRPRSLCTCTFDPMKCPVCIA